MTHTVRFTRAEVYTLTSAAAAPRAGAAISITARNAFRYTMPAYSVTTLVLRP